MGPAETDGNPAECVMPPSDQTAGRAEPVAPSRKFSAPFSGKSKTNSVAPKRGRLLSRRNSFCERGSRLADPSFRRNVLFRLRKSSTGPRRQPACVDADNLTRVGTGSDLQAAGS